MDIYTIIGTDVNQPGVVFDLGRYSTLARAIQAKESLEAEENQTMSSYIIAKITASIPELP